MMAKKKGAAKMRITQTNADMIHLMTRTNFQKRIKGQARKRNNRYQSVENDEEEGNSQIPIEDE
jgi:hypothetical protein